MKSMCHDAAAELAVGCRAQTDLLLHAHDLADRLVLDCAQPRGVDAAGGVILARLQERRRAEQAADVVGAERRRVAKRHSALIPRSGKAFEMLEQVR